MSNIQPTTLSSVLNSTGYGTMDQRGLWRATVKRLIGGFDAENISCSAMGHYREKAERDTWSAIVNVMTMGEMRSTIEHYVAIFHNAGRQLDDIEAQNDCIDRGFVEEVVDDRVIDRDAAPLTDEQAAELGLAPTAATTAAPAAAPTIDLPEVDTAKQQALDSVLSGFGLPAYDYIRGAVTGLTERLEAAEKRPAAGGGVTISLGEALPERRGPAFPACIEVKMVSAQTVFGSRSKVLDFDVPVFVWDGVHPDVPAVIEDYQFRPNLLAEVLYALVGNKRAMLTGHTGTGKTTLIEQVCALLGWPVARVNMDSDMGRMDLIGRDTLSDGTSEFVDGILPQAMEAGYVMILDEFDAGRPDILFAVQRPLEGRGLIITEDGGREVRPNSWFRMIATANTKGRGDEHGSYAGTRVLNAAMLDRFTLWAEVDYLSKAETKKLVANKGASPEQAERMAAYFELHTKAFRLAETAMPLTPRTMLEWTETAAFLEATGKEDPTRLAFDWVMLNRCPEAEAATIKGLYDRI